MTSTTQTFSSMGSEPISGLDLTNPTKIPEAIKRISAGMTMFFILWARFIVWDFLPQNGLFVGGVTITL
jgi:hypothetical protein